MQRLSVAKRAGLLFKIHQLVYEMEMEGGNLYKINRIKHVQTFHLFVFLYHCVGLGDERTQLV